MLNVLRFFIALFVVLFLAPQTHQFNSVREFFYRSGFFIDYRESFFFIKNITIFAIFILFFSSIVLK